MRGLTLTQPWATLLAIGAKKWETRSFERFYRGPVVIHSSIQYPDECRLLSRDIFFGEALENEKFPLPCGQILAIGVLCGTKRTADLRDHLDVIERYFGNYSDDRFAWEFKNVIRLKTPIVHRGMLGLWHVPDAIQDVICEQLTMRDYKRIFGRIKL